ncbi:prepilin-type N-terminal cleavage/methylation domain-containing protein [Geminisphaera colitermitum]|uniref:prepilin-type N-terminal cleavage/methylation domain-containing protein n=1 Tax=Geminisphaera colitermitum TaxID=1148786 RepID=UPI0001965195|nr:prepilin-type N-terminal cleavage/methylation domain-containing protein [Geminisphaera colitermitum]
MNSALKEPSAATARGFTLIELLTVIAIIGILAAILIPTVSRVRSTARAASCRSNLRQLGVAGLLYVEENRGTLFPYRGNNQDNGYNWLLRPWVGGETSDQGTTATLPVFICPASQIPVPPRIKYPRFTYSINKTLTALNDTSPKPRLDAIPDRSQIIFFADGAQNSSLESKSASHGFTWNARPIPSNPDAILSPATDPDDDTAASTGYFRYRHNSLCQAVFLDGSVRGFGPGKILNRNYYWPY